MHCAKLMRSRKLLTTSQAGARLCCKHSPARHEHTCVPVQDSLFTQLFDLDNDGALSYFEFTLLTTFLRIPPSVRHLPSVWWPLSASQLIHVLVQCLCRLSAACQICAQELLAGGRTWQ